MLALGQIKFRWIVTYENGGLQGFKQCYLKTAVIRMSLILVKFKYKKTEFFF